MIGRVIGLVLSPTRVNTPPRAVALNGREFLVYTYFHYQCYYNDIMWTNIVQSSQFYPKMPCYQRIMDIVVEKYLEYQDALNIQVI